MAAVADDSAFRRDSELYRAISRARLRPIHWAISEADAAALGKRLAEMFRCRSRAIRQSSK
jgi:hypothetical protein